MTSSADQTGFASLFQRGIAFTFDVVDGDVLGVHGIERCEFELGAVVAERSVQIATSNRAVGQVGLDPDQGHV